MCVDLSMDFAEITLILQFFGRNVEVLRAIPVRGYPV